MTVSKDLRNKRELAEKELDKIFLGEVQDFRNVMDRKETLEREYIQIWEKYTDYKPKTRREFLKIETELAETHQKQQNENKILRTKHMPSLLKICKINEALGEYILKKYDN